MFFKTGVRRRDSGDVFDVLTEVFHPDMTERARGVPPFVSSYVFVLRCLFSAFNHQLLAAFSAFSPTNFKQIVSKIEGEKVRFGEY